MGFFKNENQSKTHQQLPPTKPSQIIIFKILVDELTAYEWFKYSPFMVDKSKYHISFKIHRLPKMINQIGRSHWAVKAKETKDLHFLVFDAVKNRTPSLPLEKSKITLVRHSSNEPDFDNLAISFKSTMDGLKQAGVIVDDKPRHITPIYRWEKAPAKKGFIEVTVEEVD